MTTGMVVMGILCIVCLAVVIKKDEELMALRGEIRWLTSSRNDLREQNKNLRLLVEAQEARADAESLELWEAERERPKLLEVKKQGGE